MYCNQFVPQGLEYFPAETRVKILHLLHASEFDSVESRMRFTQEILRLNILAGGGPFSATGWLVDKKTGIARQPVSVAGNRVLALNDASAHAEIMAVRAGGKFFESPFWTPDSSELIYEFQSSCQPCLMCFGALKLWHRPDRLVYGATAEDAENLGFDEGAIGSGWQADMQARGVEVVHMMRSEMVKTMDGYKKLSGPIYSAG